MKADFWDVVRVSEEAPHPKIRGKLGYVAGIGEEAGNPRRSIAVTFYDLEHSWCVDEEYLILLGHKDDIAAAADEKQRREGVIVRVTVDPETGEGFLPE